MVSIWGNIKGKKKTSSLWGNKSGGNSIWSNVKKPNSRSKKSNLSWARARLMNPRLKPFADSDRDGVMNFFDCKPLNRKKKGWGHKGNTFNREQGVRMVMMKPDRFLRTTYKQSSDGGNTESEEDYQKEVIGTKYSKENIKKLKKIIQDPEEHMDIPYLRYDKQGRPIGHEGRHRAQAAKELGIKRIPVTVAKSLKEPRDWKESRKRYGYKKQKHDWRYDLENEDEVTSIKSADIPIEEQQRYGEERPEALQNFDEADLDEDDLE